MVLCQLLKLDYLALPQNYFFLSSIIVFSIIIFSHTKLKMFQNVFIALVVFSSSKQSSCCWVFIYLLVSLFVVNAGFLYVTLLLLCWSYLCHPGWT